MNRREFLRTTAATALFPAAARASSDGAPIPAIDTHTHFYDPTRPEGVPWPRPTETEIYAPHLPDKFRAVADPLAWQADPRSLAGLLDECSEAELVRRWERALAAIEAHWRRVLEQGVPPLESPASWRLRLDGLLVRLRRWLRR